MSHHEQACCAIQACCGTRENRIAALAELIEQVPHGPDRYMEIANHLIEQRVIRMSSMFVSPAFEGANALAGFLEDVMPHQAETMAAALLDGGYVVSIAEIVSSGVLAELREGLECIGVPYE